MHRALTQRLVRQLPRRLTRRVPRLGAAVLALATALAGPACSQDPYLVTTKGSLGDAALHDGSQGDGDFNLRRDGSTDGLDATAKGDTDACVPTNEGKELCDGIDNDCNGKVDDVDPVFLKTDKDNCGECGKPCVILNAFAKCADGKCTTATPTDYCAPGYHDINKDLKDGCEYHCLQSNGGVEICDQADNNCDGQIDEGFDKLTDINNCGKCGNRCVFSNGIGACQGGKCVMTGCAPGFKDNKNGDVDGCEYKCPVWPVKTEECNGLDDDCNGAIDEGLPGTGQPCDTGKLGACKDGTTQCQGGKIECVAQNTASQELCDGKDNNCDGSVDEGFDLNTNVLHCGKCNTPCTFPNAIPKCEAKVCKIDRCLNGYADLDAGAPGCEHKCEVFPTTAEKCNGKDDNCDGKVDEGFDLNADVNNCGVCGKVCSFPHAQATCVAKNCVMGACEADYYDNDKNVPGCEYYCLKTNNGVEICDGADNDCDGQTDEGFNLTTDVNNCGKCGNVCQFNNAAASCAAGKCVMGACNTGYKDLDVNTPGCEYKCPVWPAAADETSLATRCDGIDNDCDGQTDENFPTGAACGLAIGECKAGQLSCSAGIESCTGGTLPSVEICDGKDNNCNNTVDEGFDKLNDPRYCENCAGCSIPHAIPKCTNGVCGIAVCEQGWTDDPNKPGPDCDYNCTPTGPEICDGLDNDCNGSIDDGLTAPSNACVTTGACASPAPTISCQGTYGWVCAYNASVEKRTCTTSADCINVPCNTTLGICPGELPDAETLCDGLDNNCNGLVDEAFPNKGTACAETGKLGICRGTGTYVCEPVLKKSTVCSITSPGQAPKNEECNGLDDDCDGKVDEATDDGGFLGVKDAMININRGGQNFWIYTHEASRPAATSTSQGTLTTRACSKAGVLPWTNITRSAAQQACKAIVPGCVMPQGFDCQAGADCCSGTCTNNRCTAGSCAGKTQCWRLCTATEWLYACQGTAVRTYPYGNAYQPSTCNAKDNDGIPPLPDDDVLLTTGNKNQCISQDSLYDMSGNAREWTSEERTGNNCTSSTCAYTVRGGAYDTPAGGSTCQFTSAIFPEGFAYPNLGFRCCRTF